MKKGKRYKALYLPVLTIVATVLTLLIIIAVSTYRNISRERGRVEESLLREGLVIIRAIEAVVRAEFPSASPDVSRIQKITEELSREPGIAGISLFDGVGSLLVSSPAGEAKEKIVREKTQDVSSLTLLLKERGVITRYQPAQSRERTFEVIKPFRPLSYKTPLALLRESERKLDPKEEPLNQWAKDKIISLRLRLGTFEKARKQDIQHAFLMGAILVVLGTGALYFIFIVQSYYLVDRTLAQMKTYTENVVESMADGLISVDIDKKIVTLNRRAAEFLGDEEKNLKGLKISNIFDLDIETLLKDKKMIIRDMEVEIKPPSGGRFPLSLSAAPLKDETGREMGLVLLLRDLREIRELQGKVRRSERLASLGRLAAGVAHEIRNPLSSIRGFAQYFMRRLKGQEEEQGYASIMVKEVDRLNRVISELLDFARPKEPHREPHALEEILDYSLKLLESELASQGVTVEKSYEPNLPMARVDRDQFSQAFLNLLLNSLESMEGEGKIKVSLKRISQPPALEVAIMDTGRGIVREDLGKVFEPFFSTKRKGSGLGLAIVHQIVESHGGDIAVESQEGMGTTFRITLPVSEKFGVPSSELGVKNLEKL
ncbi:MAG: PAS domain S-box protein [Proteobacteria bacterium]|nr:PAS domain S-box protein [Pseudomonadota bacterium]